MHGREGSWACWNRQVPPRTRPRARRLVVAAAVVLGALALVPHALAAAVTIQAKPLGDPGLLPEFKYLINADNVGDPDDPDMFKRPGLKPMAANSPVVASGDETNATVELPDGRYLVTVLAEGHKLWGQHFRVAGADKTVTVELLPVGDGLPLGKIQVSVFRDIQPMNIAPDAPEVTAGPVEPGLAGFRVILADRVGEVSVDYYNNPLCTRYEKNGSGEFVLDGDGLPIPIPGTGGDCLTDMNGNVTIEQLPPDKYTIKAIPPDGSGWVQTTTIEGKQELDAWVTEGDEGLNIEERIFEPLSVSTAYWFGFVKRCTFGSTADDATCPTNNAAGSGSITGTARTWVGWPPFENLVPGQPLHRPWLALTNIGGNDELVFAGRGRTNGTFTIRNVPAGVYQLAIWDQPLDYITRFMTVTVGPGEAVDLGDVGVSRWFGWVSGDVFNDEDGDAVKDPNEAGFPGIDLGMRFRDGSLRSGTFTDANGHYEFAEEIGAIFKFNVLEVGFGRFARTGHSKHNELAANHPDGDHDGDGIPNAEDPDLPTEVIPGDLGGDLLLNQLTQESHRSIIDWGKRAYAPGENGGISGIVFHATTRNELDARLQAAEDYEPGLGGVPIRLWGLGDDGEPNTADDVLLNEITTDEWSHPRSDHPDLPQSCDIRDVNGNLLPEPSIPVSDNCTEILMIANETKDGAYDGGWAIEEAFDTGILSGDDADGDGIENDEDPDAFDQTSWSSLGSLVPGDYVVQAVEPDNFQVVKEENINVNDGDAFVPALPPPPCVGDPNFVDVASVTVDGVTYAAPDGGGGPDDPPVANPTFAESTLDTPNGGSPYEGQERPLCNKKLVNLEDQQNAGVEFFLFSDNAVELPGRVFGLVADNVHFELDPKGIFYGEERGIPGIPVGVRDFTGRLITTVKSDQHGFYEVLLPSTATANCPNPAGICPGMYEFVINDPGDPGSPNENFNPAYMTLSYTFDVWPGLMTPADTALDPVAGLSCNLAQDDLGDEGEGESAFGRYPEFFSVSRPYGNAGDSITIRGTSLGAAQGSGQVTLGGIPLPVTSWSDTQIDVVVPGDMPAGPRQLLIRIGDGRVVRNGLTFHVLGDGYSPALVHVDGSDTTPGGDGSGANPYQTVQAGIDAAAETAQDDLVVVHPGTYNEAVIMHSPVKLQGYGPGGLLGSTMGEILPDDPRIHVDGSVITARFFPVVPAMEEDWNRLLGSLPFAGDPDVLPGAAITVVAEAGEFESAFNAQIDGLGLSQGRARGSGGVQVHAHARHLEITNNVLEGNSGQIGGGAIAIGRAYRGDSHNDDVSIRYNRILGNGGLHRAGAIGIFAGADDYSIEHNFFCSNFSGEYGAGISHFGRSPRGRIADNILYANEAFDEGGAILVGGELAELADPPVLGTSSGAVDIERNIINSNLSNDDGGGIRLLAPLASRIKIRNNILVNNVATDFGGGIALDDASNVRIVNNTIAHNASTDTAEDANGVPSGAGLVTEAHSTAFQASLPAGAPEFSDPVLFNNIFWGNQAFTPNPDAAAIGAGPIRTRGGLEQHGCIDFEILGTGTPEFFSPKYSLLSAPYGAGDPSNVIGTGCPDENFPLFLDLSPIVLELPLTRLSPGERILVLNPERGPGHTSREGVPGDLHVTNGSPAVDVGIGFLGGVSAPLEDIDREMRPMGDGVDMGADELTGDVPLPVGAVENEPPAIEGDAEEVEIGAVLAATTGGWTGTPPIEIAFQWQRTDPAGTTWTDIAGATLQTYTTVAADGGRDVRVKVTASNLFGLYTATRTSTPVAVLAPLRLAGLRAQVSGHAVVFRATSMNCTPCSAELRLKIRGAWRSYDMRLARAPLAAAAAADTAYWRKLVRGVPSGRRAWYVRITDTDTGRTVRSAKKWVRVR